MGDLLPMRMLESGVICVFVSEKNFMSVKSPRVIYIYIGRESVCVKARDSVDIVIVLEEVLRFYTLGTA